MTESQEGVEMKTLIWRDHKSKRLHARSAIDALHFESFHVKSRPFVFVFVFF